MKKMYGMGSKTAHLIFPDVLLLKALNLVWRPQDKVLPLSPFREQVEFFRGDAAQNVQRLGGAVLVTILAASKAAVLAAGALTFPFWWPWLQAAKKNGDVKTQYGCASRILKCKGLTGHNRRGESS